MFVTTFVLPPRFSTRAEVALVSLCRKAGLVYTSLTFRTIGAQRVLVARTRCALRNDEAMSLIDVCKALIDA